MSWVLHDGASQVKQIAVFLMFRNNAAYLSYLFDMLPKIEAAYDCAFAYYIYENDSTDNTATLCRDFLSTRSGEFWTEKLGTSFDNDGTAYTRIQRITTARNRLLELCRDKLVASEWCLFIDSDIIFDADILTKMFEIKPTTSGIGVITCKSIEIMPIPGQTQFATHMHYYDTFAYVRLDDVMPYPQCCSKECKTPVCTYYRQQNNWHESDEDYDEVRSAWAGFVLVKSDSFVNPEVKWKTVCLKGESLCEHLYLCDAIRCTTRRKVIKMNTATTFRKLEK
jgi:glycosyltransferase involved in cell wall biosynthesis